MDEDRSRLLGHPFVARAARWGVVAWAGIGVLVLGYIIFRYALYPVRIIFPPLVVALVLVYVLNPIVSRLQDRGIPRLLAALITYLVFLTLIVVGFRYLIPVVADQVQEFAGSVPALVDRAQESIRNLAARVGVNLDTGLVLDPENQRQVLNFLGRLLSLTRGLFHVALILILGPILAFYLLVDLPKIRRGLRAFIPARRRPEIDSVLQDLGRALGGFFRGQLLVALFVGIASTVGLYIVGLPYWALIGMIAGLFNLIPLVGPFIGAIPAVFIAFTTTTTGEGLLRLDPGWPMALGAGIALLTVQQIDNHIISPNIVARTVKLHPVTVMLGLLAGGTILGVWGMLMAVPSIAAVKILLLHAWDTRMTWPPPPAETVPEGPASLHEGPASFAQDGAWWNLSRPGRVGAWLRRRIGRGARRPGERDKAPTEPGGPGR
ncbi:MAG TPA: AI-2E family transporter [Actinomycetota bacterium]|nr:AI-2E family transporter [Actinomycetota bacterium]